jgi:hemin uptake protein HemP
MREQPHQGQQQRQAAEQPARPRIIDATELFQQAREIWIDHSGVRYRLRVTRRNKLILQK